LEGRRLFISTDERFFVELKYKPPLDVAASETLVPSIIA